MTTEPNALVGTINHERMPVLLTEEDEFEVWLTGSSREAFELVKPFDPDRMRIVQSGLTSRIYWPSNVTKAKNGGADAHAI